MRHRLGSWLDRVLSRRLTLLLVALGAQLALTPLVSMIGAAAARPSRACCPSRSS
jgi:hypothetical protein